MAVWSIVSKSELSSDLRIDSEYYRPEALALRKRIHDAPFPKSRLEDISDSIINFGAYSLCNEIRFEENGVRFITAENIHDGYIDFASCRYIRPDQHEGLLWKSKVETCQVLVAMAARLGFAAVYEETESLNSSQDIAKVTISDPALTDPYYVAAYINSPYGRGQLLAAQTGSVQQHTNLGQIKDLTLVIVPIDVQRRIGAIFREAVAARQQGLLAAAEAETILTAALGLDRVDLTPRLFYEDTFAHAADSARFDPEYYQPAKWNVLRALAAMPGKPLEEHFRPVKQLWQPTEQPVSATVRNYDLTDALTPFLDDTTPTATAGEIKSTKKRFEPGDLVVSRLRSYLKEIAVVLPSKGAPLVGSTEFIALRSRKTGLSAEALLVFLRSAPVQTVLKWCQDGSNHPRFAEKELLRLPVPDTVLKVQDKITEKIKEAIAARQESRRLLNEAKRTVEAAIMEEGNS